MTRHTIEDLAMIGDRFDSAQLALVALHQLSDELRWKPGWSDNLQKQFCPIMRWLRDQKQELCLQATAIKSRDINDLNIKARMWLASRGRQLDGDLLKLASSICFDIDALRRLDPQDTDVRSNEGSPNPQRFRDEFDASLQIIRKVLEGLARKSNREE